MNSELIIEIYRWLSRCKQLGGLVLVSRLGVPPGYTDLIKLSIKALEYVKYNNQERVNKVHSLSVSVYLEHIEYYEKYKLSVISLQYVFCRFLGETSLKKNFQMKSRWGVGVGGDQNRRTVFEISVKRPVFHR